VGEIAHVEDQGEVRTSNRQPQMLTILSRVQSSKVRERNRRLINVS
jgi:hypothetical protein